MSAMWIAVLIVSASVGVGLIWWSVALGFTFFVLPIVLCELVLFGAIQLLRQALSPEDELRGSEREWHMTSRYPPSERSPQDHGRAREPAGLPTG